jgi:alkanesulfonate monooxygenase SsuD/methylene tetrahydromethanopterin reductase-like flavin-dependent oxidoreductase (luciferase family)
VGEERLWAIEDCLHNPVHLAKAIASLDQINGGRVEIGLATGAPFRMLSVFDVDPADYMARFSEGLPLLS